MVSQERARAGHCAFRQRLFHRRCDCAVFDFRNLHTMGMAACFCRAWFTRVCVVDRVAMALLSSRMSSIHLGGRAEYAAGGSPPYCGSSQGAATLARTIKNSPNVGRYRGTHVHRSSVVFYNGLVSHLFNCERI